MKFQLLGYFSKEYSDERGREYYFDNAKFILIFLVVLAHAISPLKGYFAKVNMLWTVINTLHMPCLIMISGYFAKSYVKQDGEIRTQRLFTYIIYYLAAQISVSLFEYFILGDTNMQKSLLNPRSSLWYLMCLIIWFTILPYIARLKPSFAMIFSIFFGLLIGYDTSIGNFMSMSRVIAHLPFFLIGYYFKKEWLFKFRNIYTQIAAGIILFFFCELGYYYPNMIPNRIITANYNYYNAKLVHFSSFPLMFINRLNFYIVAVILCMCVMLLVPRGKAIFTKLGSRTLAVYILHRFLYLADLKYKWYVPFISSKGVLCMMLIAFILTVVLSLKPFWIPFELLGKIKIKKLEKPEYSNGK